MTRYGGTWLHDEPGLADALALLGGRDAMFAGADGFRQVAVRSGDEWRWFSGATTLEAVKHAVEAGRS